MGPWRLLPEADTTVDRQSVNCAVRWNAFESSNATLLRIYLLIGIGALATALSWLVGKSIRTPTVPLPSYQLEIEILNAHIPRCHSAYLLTKKTICHVGCLNISPFFFRASRYLVLLIDTSEDLAQPQLGAANLNFIE